MNPTRRSFVKSIVSGVAAFFGFLATLASAQFLLGRRTTSPLYPARRLPYAGDGSMRLIRPPGAVPETELLAGCIRCYRCQDVCDTAAVRFFTEEHGRYAHTPYVDPAAAACNLCMRCTQVCPTDVLMPLMPEQRADVDMATVRLDTSRCLSHQSKRIRDTQDLLMELGREPTEVDAPDERRGVCGECYMVCPLRNRAIRCEPGAFLAPILFPEHCVGCGLCEEVCRVVLRGDPAIWIVPTREMG